MEKLNIISESLTQDELTLIEGGNWIDSTKEFAKEVHGWCKNLGNQIGDAIWG